MTTTIVLTVVLVLAGVAHAGHRAHGRIPASKQAWQWKYKVWMPPVWIRLAECESGSRPPNWRHDSGTYTGGFGFYIGSWQQFKYAGYPARASQATPWQQFRTALRIHARYGFSGWGCYQGSAHAWVRNGR